jgi:hypothetical protein
MRPNPTSDVAIGFGFLIANTTSLFGFASDVQLDTEVVTL